MISIILAAGKGTRMGATDRPKVCLDVAGVPVILRALETFTRCGVAHHVIVVGDRAEQVAATVCGRFPQAIFAFEHELRGTGCAARCGASVLDAFGYAGDVLVAVGDKVIEEQALREQLDLFGTSAADLCFMVGARDDSPEAGRIVENNAGRILANVEVGDIARARLIGRWFEQSRSQPLERDALRAEMLEAFLTERKACRAMPNLWRLLDERATIGAADLASCFSPDEAFFQFDLDGGGVLRLSADELERRARWVNLSVYCFRMEALRYALERLATANAQGEEYLTDAIGLLHAACTADGRPRFRVVPYPIKKATDALAFNTPDELEAIRDYYRRKTA